MEGGQLMKKRLLILCLSAVLVLALVATGCSSPNTGDEESSEPPATSESDDPAPSSEKTVCNIAVILESVDVSYQTQYDGMSDYVDHYNKTNTDNREVVLSLYDSNKNVEKQISDIETAVASGVNAIIISCVDPDGVKPSLETAMDAGIKIVDWRGIGGMTVTLLSGGNEATKGKMAHDWVEQYLEDNPDVNLKACLMQGPTNVPVTQPRMNELAKLADEMPDRFEVLSIQYGDWGTESAMKITEDWLQAFPDCNFMSVASDQMCMGTVSVLEQANKIDDMLITTVDGEALGVQMIKDGQIDMDIGCILPLTMKMSIQGAMEAVYNGFEGTIDVADAVQYLTPENVDDYEKFLAFDYENPDMFYNEINVTDYIGK
jgi:ABC-type sugar transport system substrate-binding protein